MGRNEAGVANYPQTHEQIFYSHRDFIRGEGAVVAAHCPVHQEFAAAPDIKGSHATVIVRLGCWGF